MTPIDIYSGPVIYIHMISVVVGDEFFVAGFLYGGFDKGIVVKDEGDARMKIDEAIENKDVGLVVVSKELVEHDIGYINEIKADASKPLIVELPGYGELVSN